MCWVSLNCVKKIASEDIIVYKNLKPVSFNMADSPIYCGFRYKTGVLNKRINIRVKSSSNSIIAAMGESCKYVIEEGYHSYTDTEEYIAFGTDLYKMIIPKGTVYYESNMYHEIVSENLVMAERITYERKFSLPFYIKIGNFLAKLLSTFTSYGY